MSKELDEKIAQLEKEVEQLKRIKALEAELAELKKETEQEKCDCHCQHHYWPWYQAWYPQTLPLPETKPYKVTWQTGTSTFSGAGIKVTNTVHSQPSNLNVTLTGQGQAILASEIERHTTGLAGIINKFNGGVY